MDTIDTDFTFWKDNVEKATYWEKYIANFVKELLQEHRLPEGDIMEYGSYKGALLDTIKELYPLRKITGFDTDNLANHKDIVEMDIRHLSSMREYDCSIALAINDIPVWEHSGPSKMAAYSHAMTNLVEGGYYLESRKDQYQPDFIYNNKQLKFIKTIKNIIVFQRISVT